MPLEDDVEDVVVAVDELVAVMVMAELRLSPRAAAGHHDHEGS
ncbi:hypothetical protein BRADO4886 [Bradyrhizobium sp. ORS 278]|nr:hypothetical protein BRADO4886 [Bradyrhizobium sp. ORS 278]